MFAIRRILYPTDFSEQARHAFEVACSLAKAHDAELIVLHVLPPLIAGKTEDDYGEQVRRDFLLPIQSPEPGVRLRHELAYGSPEEVIVRMAEAHGCDLIVMGTHGRTGLSRLFMGSVAEHVLHHAPCPVLTVRVPPREEPSRRANNHQGVDTIAAGP